MRQRSVPRGIARPLGRLVLVAAVVSGALVGAFANASGAATVPCPAIFVANSPSGGAGTQSVTQYAYGADGDVAPVNVIQGPNSGVFGAVGVAVDGAGYVYVGNLAAGPPPAAGTITVYAPWQGGDTPPYATLNLGPDFIPDNMVIGGNKLYVADSGPQHSVVVLGIPPGGFPAGNQTITPVQTIAGPSTNLSSPVGIALDAAGNIYVSDNTVPSSVKEFAADANGNVAPLATLTGPNTGFSSEIVGGIAIDNGRLYVPTSTDTPTSTIRVFQLPLVPNEAGNVADVAPVVTINGANTGLDGPVAAAFDPAGNLYVANWSYSAFDSVVEYSPAELATGGDVTPIADISGAATQLAVPTAIAVGGPCAPQPAHHQRPPADFDGDAKTDVSVFRPSEGAWYIQGQSGAFWGQNGDLPVPGDYNGDHKTDVAVYRPSDGAWYIQGQPGALWGGQPGDIPVPGDYNGDGTTDIAVFRPSEGAWYIQGQAGAFFGAPGDIPVPGDYNGDGKTDIAVYRPSNGAWYILNQDGTISGAIWGGQPGDVPVPGDYNGDGTTDLAVFRPSDGAWYVQGQAGAFWGQSGDVPAPGDYNGDGTTDIAVFRPADGAWYIQGQGGAFFGTNGDMPLPLPSAIWTAFFGTA